MADTIIYPYAVVVHSQNTSLAHTAMMCAGGFIVRTLLAVPQVPSLALDLVDRVFGILNVGHVSGRDPTRIRVERNGVAEDAHGGDGGENDGVYDPRGGGEAEPAVHEDEERGQVYEGDDQNDDNYGH